MGILLRTVIFLSVAMVIGILGVKIFSHDAKTAKYTKDGASTRAVRR